MGTTATFDVAATALTESHPDGIELSGVVFKITVVSPPAPVFDPNRSVLENVFDVLVIPLCGSGVVSATALSFLGMVGVRTAWRYHCRRR